MKERNTIVYLILISFFLLSMLSLMAYAETNEVKTSAKSSALYSPDMKTFIHGSNLNTKLPMASTTKIMTGLLAIENLDLQKAVTITKEAVGIEGSSLYLQEGDTLTVKDLIYSLLLASANDAAVALSLEVAQSNENFALMMNERAFKIGAYDTSFQNPHGLDNDDHYTTAHDLALITAEALKNPTFKNIAETYKYTFNINEKTRTVVNHNRLLKQYDGCIGVKTGYTKRCGRCLVSAAERDGITLIAVTLSDPNDWSDHKQMLDFGFSMLETVDLDLLCDLPQNIPVINGNKEYLSISIQDGENLYVKRKNSEIEITDIRLPYYITSNTKNGDIIGYITLKAESEVKEISIVATDDVTINKTKKHFW